MPNPEEGCADLKRVFVDHVYLHAGLATSWRHTAAISGAHTIGHANPGNSGYNGSWTYDAHVFNNACARARRYLHTARQLRRLHTALQLLRPHTARPCRLRPS
jgi:hypothetical protein